MVKADKVDKLADTCVTPLTAGDLLSSDGGNNIPAMAIVFAVVSSFNSVGVSVYQEQLFKVCSQCAVEVRVV